jgi:tRNA(Ile)-lysidine synthase TilS/MesJ
MRICQRCVLPETFPGIRFDDEGVCNVCRAQHGQAETDVAKKTVRQEFDELVKQVRPRAGYHCVLAYSGGKDSSYTLWLLAKQYDLRVLAVTFDNGFNSPQSFVNIRRIVEAVNADSIIVKPRLDLLKTVFAAVASKNPYPMKALERASSICTACITMVKNVLLRIALEQDAPMIAYGWSPGQAPLSAALFRTNAAMLKQTHEVRTAPLRQIVGDAIMPYTADNALLAERKTFPYSVNPLAFHDYDERIVRSRIEQLGWEAPRDTDGNSSNCRLNAFANRLHLERYGFHPYALEVAALVRGGNLTREEGLASLADLGDQNLAQTVAHELGLHS